jgi:hypothetical protein
LAVCLLAKPYGRRRGGVADAAFVKLAPTLSNPLTARYVLLRYGLGEPRMAAMGVAAHFQDKPLDEYEAEFIASRWDDA